MEWLVSSITATRNEKPTKMKQRKKITPDEQPKKKELERTTDRNDYSFIVVKILDFIVTHKCPGTRQ